MRILVGAIGHESNTFSPLPTRLADFTILRGTELLSIPAVQPQSTLAGIVTTLQEAKFELVPTLAAHAQPGGVVERAAFEALKGELLAQAHDVDGACVALHGAMRVEGVEDADTDLAVSLRRALGPDAPITVGMDMHGSVTAAWVASVNAIVAYHTAPHVDQFQTGAAAATILRQTLRQEVRPVLGFTKLPLLMPGEFARTASEPMATLMRLVAEIESQPGILSASLIKTHCWSDAYDQGVSTIVVADGDAALAQAQANRLAAAVWERRADFYGSIEAYPMDEAIEVALAANESPVFISDSGDNPTAGGTTDVPALLERLLAHGVRSAALAALWDPAAVDACRSAGVGAEVTLALGGKVDVAHGSPLRVTGRVRWTSDQAPGLGPVAVLTVGGVEVLLSRERVAITDPAPLRAVGIEPLDYKLVVVKLGYLFPALAAISPRSILALSPGATNCDVRQLAYRRVRRPIYPLDPETTWASG